MKKTLFTALVSLSLLSAATTASASPNTTPTNAPTINSETPSIVAPAINGEFGVSIDAITGEVYYGKNEHTLAYPASITKVLTAIIVDEQLADGEMIPISKLSSEQEPSNSQLLLKEGEEISKEDALEMLLILSSNDVAHALAEKVSGSVENFAVLMNERASELGAQNSNFVTPNGLPNELHKTTAFDMAMIGKQWLEHPTILEIVQRTEAEIAVGEKTYTITPKHSIFTQNPKAIGGKTGWTIASGNTLLEILENGDEKVVTVVMKTSLEKEYDDINIMSEFAFQNFETKKFFEKGDTVLTFEAQKNDASLIAVEPILASYKEGEKILNKIVWENKTNFVKDETAAWLALLDEEGNELKRFPLAVNKSISVSDDVKRSLMGSDEIQIDYGKILTIFTLIVFIPILIFFILYYLTHRKKPAMKK